MSTTRILYNLSYQYRYSKVENSTSGQIISDVFLANFVGAIGGRQRLLVFQLPYGYVSEQRKIVPTKEKIERNSMRFV